MQCPKCQADDWRDTASHNAMTGAPIIACSACNEYADGPDELEQLRLRSTPFSGDPAMVVSRCPLCDHDTAAIERGTSTRLKPGEIGTMKSTRDPMSAALAGQARQLKQNAAVGGNYLAPGQAIGLAELLEAAAKRIGEPPMNNQAARSIVERLAAIDEPLHDSGFGDTLCGLCGANRPHDDHDGDCPWRLARELVVGTSS